MRHLISLCVLIIPLSIQAQWRGLVFESFGAREGLNSEEIRAMCQDSIGYLYLAGYQQLLRYDGNAFEEFANDPNDSTTIGPGQIVDMLATEDGRIWISMRRAGLNVFDPETRTFQRFPAPVINNSLGMLIDDRHGTLWTGADKNTLVSFDRQTKKFSTYGISTDIYPSGEGALSGLAIDDHDQDVIWVSSLATAPGDIPGANPYHTLKFNISSGTFTPVACTGDVLLLDPRGVLWSGSWEHGISRYDTRTGECRTRLLDYSLQAREGSGNAVFAIFPYQDEFWVGSRGLLLSVNDALEMHTLFYEELPNKVNDMLEDRQGNVWIGTTSGLKVMQPGHQHIAFYDVRALGLSERIYPGRLAYDAKEDAIYLASRNTQRIYRIPLSQEQPASAIETPHRIYGLAIDRDGRLIVAMHSTLFYCNFPKATFERIHSQGLDTTAINWMWCLKHYDNGLMTGVGDGVVYWMDDRALTPHVMYLPEDEYYSTASLIAHDSLILSGGTGAYQIDLNSGRQTRLTEIPNEHVIRDNAGSYWVGTINSIGRYRLRGDSLHLERFYSAKDGLRNFTANQLHLDQRGRIWIFSNSGMSVLDPVSGETRNVGVDEGLLVPGMDPVQILTLPDGRMCTVNGFGIIVFHPDSLWNATSPRDAEIVFKEVRVNGTAMALNKSSHEPLHILPGQNTIDVLFQGLSYPTDKYVKYSYMLKGLHNDWVDLGRSNSVTLSGLSPGHYTFMVKSGSPRHAAPVQSFEFILAAPFYRQWWFLILTCAMVIAIVYLVNTYRIRKIREQEAEKTRIHKQISELELQALRAQMNPHFMFNSLNSIKNYILRNESARAAEYLSNFAHLIRLILQNSREKTISLQEELDTLLLYIELEKLRFRDGFEFTCQIDDAINIGHVHVPPMIIQPHVENAIWHGLLHKENDRHLAMRISRQNGTVLCEIEDNGIGRSKANEIKSKSATRYKSMGMQITRDRIALMNSMSALGIHIDVFDKTTPAGESDGTLVKISIPDANISH